MDLPRRSDWSRGVLAGVGWMLVLFVWDTLDSYYLIRRSTRRIRSDEEITDILTDAILSYVARMGLAYLLLGCAFGITMVLVARVWRPRPIHAGWKWWRRFALGSLCLTMMAYGLQATLFPPLYDHIPGIQAWAEYVTPGRWMVLAVGVLCVLGWRSWIHWEGEDRSQLMKRSGVLLLWIAVLTLVFRNPEPDAAVDNEAVNLVIIGVDALRPDHLGYYGYERPTSPNIDALLAESVVFDQAFTPLGRTYPSWVSILSGTLPIHTGIRDNLPESERLIPDQVLFPQVFRDAGYATTFVTDDSRFSYMVPEMGFENIVQPPVGVENFAISVNEPRYRAFHGLLHNPIGFGIIPSAAYNQSFGKSYRPSLFIDKAVDALAETSEEGAFLYAVHTCVLHVPGDRVHPWHRLYGQDEYRGRNRFHYSRSGTDLLEEDEVKGKSPEQISEQDVRIYDSGIDMADQLVGRIVSELKESGLWDNTIVVLLSDHGEELWTDEMAYRYNGPNHGFHPYGDGQNRVVMSVRVPESLRSDGWVPRQVERPARLIDLAPTLTGLFDLDWPADTDGRDLVPLLEGVEDEDRLVYMETGFSEKRYWPSGHKRYPKGMSAMSTRFGVDASTGRVYLRPEILPHLTAAKDRVMQQGRWKLVWRAMEKGSRVELYDRFEDPHNLQDLSGRHPEIVARLGIELRTYLEEDGIESPRFARWEALLLDGEEDEEDQDDDPVPNPDSGAGAEALKPQDSGK